VFIDTVTPRGKNYQFFHSNLLISRQILVAIDLLGFSDTFTSAGKHGKVENLGEKNPLI
jgi:hypothetical protein